jgi:hypothetical protein
MRLRVVDIADVIIASALMARMHRSSISKITAKTTTKTV